MLIVSLLGDFSIKCDTTVVKNINAPRLQSLLACLILHSDIPQNRSHLAFLFWPETNETQARTNLRNLLHQLRCALPKADVYIDSDTQTIQWRPNSKFTLDVLDFKNAVNEAEEASANYDSIALRKGLERAIDLYKGDLLPGCYDDWVTPFREELRQQYINTLEQLVNFLEENHDYTSAINYAQRLVSYDPLLETPYQSLIRLHALNDDRANALRVFHVCETILERELNVKPSLATFEMYEALLSETRRSYFDNSRVPYYPIVGREQEWAQMINIWRNLIKSQGPHILLLCGEAGIGKTRLIEEFYLWVSRQGYANASTRCYAAEDKLAYAPIINWLRAEEVTSLEDIWLTEIARLLPELMSHKPHLLKPGPLTEEWQQTRLFEALSHAVFQYKPPFLLTIDDLQWCDQDTLAWLHYILHFDRSARFLIVASYRPEEVESSHPLETFLGILRAEGWVTELSLNPLNESATASLASSITGLEISQDVAQFLYRKTEGNPLFLVEMLQTGLPLNPISQQDHLQSISSTDFSFKKNNLPLKVQSILQARIDQLSPESKALACLAGTLGREFSFPLLKEASGWDEDALVNALDELWQRRIIREQGIDGYDFSHDKLREVAYHSMSPARRRLLHRQVAQALEAFHAANLGSVSNLVAAHYEQGGLPERAVPFYLIAAKNARKVYANNEAKNYLQRGLKIIETPEELDETANCLAVNLWEALGDLQILSAEHENALDSFKNAQKKVRPTDRIDQARLYRKIAEIYRGQRDYSKTLEACEQAEALLGKKPRGDFDQWWDEWIDVQIEKVWVYYWLARWQDLEELVDRISLVVKARASAPSRMRFLKASCLTNLRKFRYSVTDEMLENSKENLATSHQYGSLQDQMECYFELGFLHLWRFELDGAEENLQLSLTLTEKTGNLLFQTLCLTYITVLYRFQGRLKEVRNLALRTGKSAERAHMPDYTAAAKANLAWLDWRKGDLIGAEQKSQEALEIWQGSPLVYPFQWMALWPMIGIALAENRQDDLVDLFQKLLVSTQQILPDDLNEMVKTAVQDQKFADSQERPTSQKQAVEIAKLMGYL